MNSRQLIKRLRQNGWILQRVRGSHHIYSHPERNELVVVPHPRKDIPIGTLKSIFKQAGW